MFKSDKPKNAFLQKKNQEKAKAAEQVKNKVQTLLIQKNIRTFLDKKKFEHHFKHEEYLKLCLIMKRKLT